VTSTLEDAGYETWAVGGAVRNTLLGFPSGDWDLATRAPPGVVRRLFPARSRWASLTAPWGSSPGRAILLEVTTFRRDVETFGRRAVVEFADTLQEDLSRRDFTVNAVAWHPIREEFQDPFGGREDLAAGLLRAVGVASRRFRRGLPPGAPGPPILRAVPPPHRETPPGRLSVAPRPTSGFSPPRGSGRSS
jgi:tRNA nucleotidyltransferase (CCA-adding enzyme)